MCSAFNYLKHDCPGFVINGAHEDTYTLSQFLPLPKTGKGAQGVGLITAVTYLFPFRQLLMDKLSINNARSFCCWRQ